MRDGERRGSLNRMETAYIGMGGNLASWAGTAEATLTAAALRLETLGRVTGRSSLYSTEPVGFAEQPRFVNAVAALETELGARALLRGLLAIEQEFGRDRSASFQNGPRTLDLDILLLGGLKISEPGLEIPHPRLAERLFVLTPLCEIAPRLVDPASGQTMSQLLHALEGTSVGKVHAVVKIEFGSWRAGAAGVGSGKAAGADGGHSGNGAG